MKPSPAEAPTGALQPRLTSLAADMPSRIGRYIVLDELGAGGMGIVYAAYDPELDRKVAIKLMYAESDDARARRSQALLRREAQALAKLSHTNIVAIHDVGVYAGQIFVAMEFVAGRTLRRWRDEAPRDWQEIVGVFVQAGRGLMAAHAIGLIHRDVKPDNLLVGDDGRVRVADFGLARYNGPEDSQVTAESGSNRPLATVAGRGAVVGTPVYMAPEQHDNSGVGPHSDQFSFCVALYEALHQVRPFAGDTTAELVAAVRAGPLRSGASSRLPGWLDRAVLRGLAARPEDRWPSMQALLEVLGLDEREARSAHRRRQILQAALVVLAGVALYFGARALQASRTREQAEQAAGERLKVAAAGIDRLLARGRRAEAEEALQAFLGEPEHHASRAVIDAWLLWADRMDAAGDREAALNAAVEAYTGLPEDDAREPAIFLRIARLFRIQWRFDELATIARRAAERWPQAVATPVWSQLRADAALARRDLGSFLAEVDAGQAGRPHEDVAPVLRALNAVTYPGVTGDAAVLADREAVLFSVVGSTVSLQAHAMNLALSPSRALGHDHWLDGSMMNVETLRSRPGAPGHLLGHRDGLVKLYELGADRVQTVFSWPDDRPSAATAADLDGDGVREFYVGTGSYTRKLHRIAMDADGVWQRSAAHPGTESLGSDINALARGDFDGDGRDELAVALGPWRAYDVRILQATAGGGLEVGARWRIGHVRALATLRGPDGSTLLAIAKDNAASSKQAFSADKPDGEPPGLYVVRRDGEALTTVFHAPFPAPEGPRDIGHVRWMSSGDLDGDGLDDLVLRHEAALRREFASTLLFRQLPNGSFALAPVGHVIPLLVGDFDGDRADELLVTTRQGDQAALAILGAGAEPLARVVAPGVEPAPSLLADPVLARAWGRAEDLAGFGLYAAAAAALERRLTLVQARQDGRAISHRIAELYAAAKDHARAAAVLEALAQDGDVDAALAASDEYERALRLADALRLARGLLVRVDLSPAQRSRAHAASERLAAVVERRDALELRFDRPLAEDWRISEPLALRLDGVRGVLAVEAFADAGDLMALPIDLTGGPLTVEFELEVERAEWAAQIAVSVRRPDGEAVMTIGVAAGGGGGFLRRHAIFSSPESHGRHDFGTFATDSPTVHSNHVLQVRLLPEHHELDMEERGDHPERRSQAMEQTLLPGRHLLVLHSTGAESHGPQELRARIRRIAVGGARLAAADAPATADDRLAHALVTGQWREVWTGSASSEFGPLWRATAAAELGRIPEAIATLATVDPQAPALRKQLRQLLRAQPVLLLPLMRAAFGARHAALLREALATATRMHLDEELQRVWLRVGADLAALPADDAAQIDAKAELLAMRAAAWQAVGDGEQAAADLSAAIALRQPGASALDERIAELELRAAEVAAERGRPDEVLVAVTHALARSTTPAFMAERLRLSPRFQVMQSDPRWRALLAVYP